VHRLASVFALNRVGLTLRRGATVTAIEGVLVVAVHALGLERYSVSLLFGVLFTALSDPVGTTGQPVGQERHDRGRQVLGGAVEERGVQVGWSGGGGHR
jgi:hypothetical protein